MLTVSPEAYIQCRPKRLGQTSERPRDWFLALQYIQTMLKLYEKTPTGLTEQRSAMRQPEAIKLRFGVMHQCVVILFPPAIFRVT